LLRFLNSKYLAPLNTAIFSAEAFFELGISHLVDHPAKGGRHMEQVKDDLGLREFFLTALIKGSHMSMATAFMN
jgi:hypothetical protein